MYRKETKNSIMEVYIQYVIKSRQRLRQTGKHNMGRQGRQLRQVQTHLWQRIFEGIRIKPGILIGDRLKR